MRLDWSRISPKEQSHGMCRYCEESAEKMNKTKNGNYIPVCNKHEKDTT